MRKFGGYWPNPIKTLIFAPRPSAVTLSEKVQLGLSLMGHVFQWAYDEQRALLLSLQRLAQKREVSKI